MRESTDTIAFLSALFLVTVTFFKTVVSVLSMVKERNQPREARLRGFQPLRRHDERTDLGEPYLTSGINLVPLAPITNVRENELPGLVKRMTERINAEPQANAAKLWTATYLLMGLRFSEQVISHLLEGVQDMQESSTYQAILKQGRVTGERQLLIRQGTKKFGPPDAAILAAIESIRDVERLEALGERILDADVRDWNSLLGAP